MTTAEATAEQKPLKFYPKQGQFIVTPAHYAAFVAGIGSGKTVGGAARGFLAACGYVGKKKVLRVPNLGMVTAPTYTMMKDASLRAFLEIADGYIAKFNKSEMVITLLNKSEIIFRSADNPDRLRGPSLAWWWGDEAALYDNVVWLVMIGRLRQYGQLGYAWVSSTPRGRNWLWRTFVRDNGHNPDYFLRQASSADNVYLDRAIIQAWQQSYVGDFAKQELGGQFVAFEGLIYSEFDRAAHVSTVRPQKFTRVLAGVDWGFVNPGVIVIAGQDYDGRLYFVHEEYARQRHIDDWVLRAVQLRDTWGIESFYCDPSEPDYIAKLENAGLRAYKANNTVTTGIQAVKARLVRRTDGLPYMVFDPAMANTISEFEQYQWDSKRTGMIDMPLKLNDHTMDAARYLVMAVDYSENVSPLVPNVGNWLEG